jgi:hypothetical protein
MCFSKVCNRQTTKILVLLQLRHTITDIALKITLFYSLGSVATKILNVQRSVFNISVHDITPQPQKSEIYIELRKTKIWKRRKVLPLSDLPTKMNCKYFILKSHNLDNLKKSFTDEYWCVNNLK